MLSNSFKFDRDTVYKISTLFHIRIKTIALLFRNYIVVHANFYEDKQKKK